MEETKEQDTQKQDTQEQVSAMPAETTAGKTKPKLPVVFIGIGAAAAALIVLAIVSLVMLVNTGKTINLNKYASITVTGYDAYATAEFEFDKEKFKKDYEKRIKYIGSGNDIKRMEAFYGSAADCLVSKYVEGSFDKDERISNGDVIVYTWDCDEEAIEEIFGYEVKCSDIKLTVKGLEEVDTFDPFEGVKITYSGIEPDGTVQIQSSSDARYVSKLRFWMSPSKGLSNGDVVTVRISDGGSKDSIKYYIDTFDALPSVTEKQFIVEGLGEHATSASRFSEDAMEQMKTQAEDIIKSYVAYSWTETASLDSCKYIGNYFLAKKGEGYRSQRYMEAECRVILVYEIQATISDESRGIQDTFTYYTGVYFDDSIVFPDGTSILDLAHSHQCDHRFTKNYPVGRFGYSYRITGYKSLEALKNDYVIALSDAYYYEDNVSQ